MKKSRFIAFLLLVCYSCCGQSVADNSGVPGPAKVSVKWSGEGNAQLFFNGQEYTFGAGRELTLAFTSAKPYTLKVKTLNKDYLYSEFLVFEKGQQDIEVSLQNDTLLVSSPIKAIREINDNMVFVEGGEFTMGCPNISGSTAFDFERPNPTVILSSFYICKYDVTQSQWFAVMGSNPSHFRGCAECPVESISWNDAQEFIKKLNSITGKHFRLPTNAEWEYAAKGGNKARGYRYAGSNDLSAVAWYYDDNGSYSTHPVGQKQPNELGLYDMNGNVFQWCSDWYDVNNLSKLYADTIPAVNPKGPSEPLDSTDPDPQGPYNGKFRVVRGEAWWLSACYISTTICLGYPPDYRWADSGLRLVEDY